GVVTHEELGAQERLLEDRHEEVRGGRIADDAQARVADDADDLHIALVGDHVTTDRIPSGPGARREAFVDDRYARGAVAIGIAERAPAHYRQTERREEVGRHDVPVGVELLLVTEL